MLYKKYHRSFVRKFKKGVKFRVYDAHLRKVVRGFLASGGFICIEDNSGCIWDLVYPGGRINKDPSICYTKNITETTLSNLRKIL